MNIPKSETTKPTLPTLAGWFKGVSTSFASMEEAREIIRKHAAEEGTSLTKDRNGQSSAGFSKSDRFKRNCSGDGCKWYVLVRENKMTRYFHVSCPNEHTCNLVLHKFKRTTVSSDYVASLIRNQVSDAMGHITTKTLQAFLKREHGLKLKYAVVNKDRLLAQNSIKGSEIVAFAYMWDYLNALKVASDDNITHIDSVPGTINWSPIRRFLYAQVVLGCVRQGHKHLRPIDKLDGGFLKTEYGGTLGMTVTKDAEDQVLITSVSVSSMHESFDHWDRHLRNDTVAYYMAMIGNPLSPDTAVSASHVTDRKQGLLLATEKHTPTFFSFA
eukprot:g12107.t1